MKITTMMRDIFQSLMSEPATGHSSNAETSDIERLRGKLQWQPENCTGCQLCIKDCPSGALKLFVVDKATKQFVMRYDAGRCIFCAQCVENCRFNCLDIAQDEWALADNSKENFITFYGDQENVAHVLADTHTDDLESDE